MKRVRVHNKGELLFAVEFYRKLKPNSKVKLAAFDFDEEMYKCGISVGYDTEESDSVYLFLEQSRRFREHINAWEAEVRMIKVGDLVRGKKEENGNEYYGVTSSKSICEVREIGIEDWIIVALVNTPDYVKYIGHEFEVRVNRMEKIYNKTE